MSEPTRDQIHALLSALPRRRIPFEEATPETYGRLYDSVKSLEAEVHRLRAELADARQSFDDVCGENERADEFRLGMLAARDNWAEFAQQVERERDEARAALARLRDNALDASKEYEKARQETITLREQCDALTIKLNRAEADRDQWRATFGESALRDGLARMARTETERDRLAEQTKRVRARHAEQCSGACASTPCECEPGDLLCAECETPYPCPTILDLDRTGA